LGLEGIIKMSWKKTDGLMKQIAHYANFVSQAFVELMFQRG